MGFLNRRRGSNGGTELERLLREGLANFGSRRGEVVPWVMTGLPSNPNLSAPMHGFSPVGPHSEAMLEAVGDADPIVEWRLGLLMSQGIMVAVGPTKALGGLWKARGGILPDDERIDEMLVAAGVAAEDHLVELLTIPRWEDPHKDELRRRTLFDRLVRNHPDTVRGRLSVNANEVESVATALLAASGDALNQLSDSIAGLMTSTSKKRRAAGWKLGNRVGYSPMAEHLQQIATNADGPARAEAIRSLGRLGGSERHDEVVAFCESNCADARSLVVQDAIAGLTTSSAPVAAVDVKLPDVDGTLPDDAARAAYDAMFDKIYEADRAWCDRAREWLKENPDSPDRGWAQARVLAQRAPQEVVDAWWRYICNGGSAPIGLFERHHLGHYAREIVGDLRPLHAFRLLRVTGNTFPHGVPIPALLSSYRETGHPTPLELQAAAEDAGYGRRDILAALPKKLPWSADDTWPWVAALLRDFLEIITAGETEYWDNIDKYYAAIGCLPTLPADLRQLLLAQAVSGRKTHRPLAKAALAADENLVSSVIEYLASRKYDERAEAALWLVELEAGHAIPELHKAAAKEKHDHAKGAILTALERLGEPIDRYIDRERLLAEAKKGLCKKLPTAAEWIPLDSLPPLRWEDDAPVDAAIAKWLVVQAVRLKSPSPSPIVRRFFDQMKSEDVEEFASAILAMWIAEDIRSVTLEAATDLYRQQARNIRANPEWYGETALMSDDQLMAHLVRRQLDTPVGSAAASKGVLSLAAAGGGLSVVAPAEAFLRKWYGMRLSQCKALVEMLAWVEDPTAIQVVLSVGSRFRTKGIRQEAVRQTELLAERRGWSLEDLAYRTVPTGGFDADGTQVLDYGERQFTARLADDLTIALSNADGKQVKALPGPRKTEDEAIVKLAKKELSRAKKQIKAAAKKQPLRLHEAMCVQRRFDVDDYRRYVIEHPVMSRLATRLTWVAEGLDDHRTLFRPLSDGTLLDQNDEAVALTTATAVRLAHGAVDGEDLGVAWKQHYIDYRIAPLFAQFGRPQIPELAPAQDTLTDCEGVIIDDRRLRSVINKIGYELGPGEDAGIVSVIVRRFPSAGLEARIGVRGLHAMIVKQDVGLTDMRFGPLDGYETVALAEVPPVLLVETIADIDQIVAAGEGIVEDWEKRVGW